MKTASRFLIIVLSILLSYSLSAQYAGRTEVHPLQSTTLSTAQFLTGQAGGKPVILAGELRLPPGKPGAKYPAMVFVHGSSGIGINIDRWARELNKIGVAAFVVDSFTARGIVTTSTDQGLLDHLAMLYDAYRALDLLASHPRIDPKRIGIIGFSKGGVAGLYAAMDRFNNLYGSKKSRFALYMAFYPPCYQYRDDEKVDNNPIIIFHGEADDYVPMAPCREYVNRLQAKGVNIKLIGYANAYHGFDLEGLPEKVYLPAVQQAVKCRVKEGQGGDMLNADTGKPFSRSDACAGKGATVGYNRAAHQKSIEDMVREVSVVFKLEGR
jgi:dienelactone hydrolase